MERLLVRRAWINPDTHLEAGFQPLSISGLFRAVRQSAEKGIKRDVIADMQNFLKLKGLQILVQNFAQTQPLQPVVIAPNHFKQDLKIRKSFYSTQDSLTDSSITTLAATSVLGINNHTSWIILPLSSGLANFSGSRETQNATAYCYDYIQLTRSTSELPLDEVKKIIRTFRNHLNSGHNIGLFPEQYASRTLKHFEPGFTDLLGFIQKQVKNIAVVPTSIWVDKKTAHVNFSEPVNLEEGKDLNLQVVTIRERILNNLPRQYHPV